MRSKNNYCSEDTMADSSRQNGRKLIARSEKICCVQRCLQKVLPGYRSLSLSPERYQMSAISSENTCQHSTLPIV
ncbi:hypothetical protein DPMN_185528 [Dreissena polymorpha]|uniref:Uncharacterized protein n=1 Tax=Dreissena polymorpha TaxID=45954 RepID=A0A9D4DL44_DREPO|nr:hypothetical protein DPMN_185528 [Dreissena polymorpha]